VGRPAHDRGPLLDRNVARRAGCQGFDGVPYPQNEISLIHFFILFLGCCANFK
jgi:hypothetical protein